MCKVSIQEEERLGQSHPEQCAKQAFQNADKSSRDSRRNSRRNRDQKPTAEEASVTTAELEPPQQETVKPAEDSKPSFAEEYIAGALAKLLTHMAVLASTTASTDKPAAEKSCSFQSVRAPQVSLSSYASRIRKFFRCTDECFVLCLVFIDRIVKCHPEIEVTDLTCHRLLLVGTMVAAKFHDDEYASNAYFAKVGGIETAELNALEAEFLELINWRLYVTASDYDWYLNALRGIP